MTSTNAPENPLLQLVQRLQSTSQFETEVAFEESRTVESADLLIRKISLTADSEIARFHSLGNRPVCGAGCSHCCYRTVHATAPEILTIWKHVQSDWSASELESLQRRSEAFQQSVTAAESAGSVAASIGCPFLEDDRCTVYENRPLSCRGRNSTQVEPCRRLRERPGDPIQIPSIREQDAIAESLLFGHRVGLHFEALSPGLYSLGSTLAILFRDHDAPQRYFDGNPVLEPAALAMPGDPLQHPDFSRRLRPAFRSDQAQSEPSGELYPADAEWMGRFHALWLHQARFDEAMDLASAETAAQLVARIDVPRAYRNETEIGRWRQQFTEASSSLSSRQLDPAALFNALAAHATVSLSYQGKNDCEVLSKHGSAITRLATVACLPDLTRPLEGKRKEGRFRLGYVSANMRNSSGSSWALGWIRNHGEDIETYALNVGTIEDSVTYRFQLEADHYFHLMRGTPECARFIRSLDLDVLIFTDVGTNGRTIQLGTMRLARVQCAAWGHPETSGLPMIDYYLSSELMEPDSAQDHYSEELVLLPRSGITYPRIKPRPAKEMSPKDFGLDDGPFCLVPHVSPKLLPTRDDLFREISDRTGRPIVFSEVGLKSGSIITKERMARRGINAIWLPTQPIQAYFRLLALADVILDPPDFNGGIVTLDALSLGKPVVTLPGTLKRGRHTKAFLETVGAPGLIASDEEDYVDLACDPHRRANAMESFDADALFDDPLPTLALDEFVRRVSA